MEGIDMPWPVSKIDIDQNRDAAITYGIRSVPTLILLDENENIIKKTSGAMTVAKFKEEFGLE
jgi:thioredoxin-like negative regulator of GroEL